MAIRTHLEAALAASAPLKIATFAALPGEPELTPCLSAAAVHLWHFPRVDGDCLRFYRVDDACQLEPGAYGIPEPCQESEEVPVGEFDWILCPGLGFGRDGSRLGRGKGYYDRALAGARPDAWLIGTGFEEQFVEALPCEDHDLPMTHALRPRGFTPIR
ncbi:5-formyltetrahydrofolate cyclo-ligase [Haloferula helveola]|uniref:5-formyltetrahydrofolate cyclo-ligase n=1 Tax=Haloferula helveola TaxID=490095 RepID=A0ABN6H957_9BACT|nr:5-formyltetrahydrofolate cyclo-ligase [Haloferula helveola]